MNTLIPGKKLIKKLLPAKEIFFSELKKFDISDKDCKHAQKVWNSIFNIKKLGDYQDLYNKITLLSYLAKNFRKNMNGKYDLYPLNIVSLATFSCQYALKITGTEIGLLTDVKLAFHYENGIRGRIT